MSFFTSNVKMQENRPVFREPKTVAAPQHKKRRSVAFADTGPNAAEGFSSAFEGPSAYAPTMCEQKGSAVSSTESEDLDLPDYVAPEEIQPGFMRRLTSTPEAQGNGDSASDEDHARPAPAPICCPPSASPRKRLFARSITPPSSRRRSTQDLVGRLLSSTTPAEDALGLVASLPESVCALFDSTLYLVFHCVILPLRLLLPFLLKKF
jgi:hypothetical protein